MDRYGTERLADASFLEELLRGKRTVVVVYGDAAPAQHLQKRLGGGIIVVDPPFTAPLARPDRSADAVVALGGFQEPDGIEKLISEARRVLAPGGIFAASWVDPSRASLEASPAENAAGRTALSPSEAQRRLAQRFSFVAVVARQPYLGFQFVSGVDNNGAVPLDTSLTAGGTETPTGFLAIAADSTQSVGDLLVQVPYDRAVGRVKEWLRSPAPASGAAATQTGRSGQAVARPRDGGGNELEKLRAEVAGLRDRAQAAVEDSDRARGEARGSRERAALLEAEVTKVRARLKGAPDPEAGEIRLQLEQRVKERDQARRDAESAAGAAANLLEGAAKYERECDHLNEKVNLLEADLAKAKAERDRAIEDLDGARKDFVTAKNEAEASRADAQAAREELGELRAGVSKGGDAAAAAEKRVAEAEKKTADVARRAEQTLKRLQDAEKRVAELEALKTSAERSAEDAWKRLKEAQSAPAAAGPSNDDLVPAADLAAVQRTLASAIARAEEAERGQRELREGMVSSGAETPAENPAASQALRDELDEMRRTLQSVREELEKARARGEDSEARVASAQRLADDARSALEASRPKRGVDDAEGLRSLVHQRETALKESRERVEGAEARAARFATESADALSRLKTVDETLGQRDIELKKALSALDGVEMREARDKELMAELKGEVARLTEALTSAREDLLRARSLSASKAPAVSAAEVLEHDQAVAAAGMAQAESARAHADADALREELQGVQNEIVRLLAETDKRGGQDTERERRIADLEGQLLQARSRGENTGDIERRTVQMSQKLTMLEAELERAKDDVKQATAEARKYRALAEAIEPPADRSGKA